MLLLCALIVGSGSLWATDETLVFNTDAGLTAIGISKPSSGSGTNLGDNTYVQGDVSLSATDGSTDTRVWNSSGTTSLRVYNGGTLTIEVPASKDITSIVFTGTTNFTADGWNSSTKTWSGTANSVTFTNTSSGSTIQTIKVTYGDADPRTAVDINSLTFSASYVAVDGATVQATAGHNTPACTTATFTYESLDDDKAICTSDGVITAVAKGTARIKATMSIPNDDPNYRVGTATKTVNIEVKKAFHTATFYVNGASTSGSFEEDQAVSFPDDPSNLGGKAFVGWKKGSGIAGTTDVAPSLVTKATETMDDDDVDYYAVYATSASATVTKTDELTLSTTGVSGTSYSAWSGKSATGGSAAVYSGCNAGGNSAIQLNATTGTSYRGIISTTSGGKLKKVTITWNSNTSNGRSVTVYGSNSAYTTMSAFDSSKGTSLGTITKNTSTELSITGNYTYVGFYATQAIYMDKISIDWETTGTTYSAYCTTVNVAITPAKEYTTLTSAYALDFTDNVNLKAYIAKSVAGGKVTLTQVNKVPAETGLVLKASTTGSPINVLALVGDSEDMAGNKMVGSSSSTTAIAENGGYILKDGVFQPALAGTLAAGKAYLNIAVTSAHPLELSFEDGDVTSINKVEAVKPNTGEYYNLAGQRVAQPTKGLYIVNGKKVILKKFVLFVKFVFNLKKKEDNEKDIYQSEY